jgi:hypothetical protein
LIEQAPASRLQVSAQRQVAQMKLSEAPGRMDHPFGCHAIFFGLWLAHDFFNPETEKKI